jgi:hypothetical protein
VSSFWPGTVRSPRDLAPLHALTARQIKATPSLEDLDRLLQLGVLALQLADLPRRSGRGPLA